MSEPVAVVMADIHFSVSNLGLAVSSLRAGRTKASALGVPLVIAGDLIDGKAILRGEVENALISIFTDKEDAPPWTYVIVGNHDLIHEKSSEHSLTFLKAYTGITVVDTPLYAVGLDAWLLPYASDLQGFVGQLSLIKSGSRIICHQGIQTAKMGHYVIDKTSVPKEVFKDYRVISGHYHIPQDIKCGRPRKNAVGLFSYVGSPYTHSFAEAGQAAKLGYSILFNDGSIERENIDLRRHVIIEKTIYDEGLAFPDYKLRPDTLLWLKVTGPESELRKLKKEEIGKCLLGHSNFKLDLIPTADTKVEKTEKLTSEEIFDKIIDASGETDDMKAYLKSTWRELM